MRRIAGATVVFLILCIALWEGKAALPDNPSGNLTALARECGRFSRFISEWLLSPSLFRTEQDDSSNWESIGEHNRYSHHKEGGNKDDRVIVGASYQLGRRETNVGDVVLADGPGQIEGTIDGDLVLVGSSVSLSGTVNGDLATTGSRVAMNPGAVVNGDYCSIASDVAGEQNLSINGERVSFNGLTPAMPALKEILGNILLLRTMSPTSVFSWVLALTFLALCLALGLTLPEPGFEDLNFGFLIANADWESDALSGRFRSGCHSQGFYEEGQ
jgi:hypothetical protein